MCDTDHVKVISALRQHVSPDLRRQISIFIFSLISMPSRLAHMAMRNFISFTLIFFFCRSSVSSPVNTLYEMLEAISNL